MSVRAHCHGSCQQNQRIEAWWSHMRRSKTTWMIHYFKEMIDNNLYDPSSDYQAACAQFCFMKLIQKELDHARMHWNTHMIRRSKQAGIAGRPDQMHYLPENNGCFDQLYPCNQHDINELNSCLDIRDEDRERDNIFDEHFVYLQNYMYLSDSKT